MNDILTAMLLHLLILMTLLLEHPPSGLIHRPTTICAHTAAHRLSRESLGQGQKRRERMNG